MSDRIFIRDLLARTIIGINDWEREQRQDVLLNLTLFTELKTAGESDDVLDALNYRTLNKEVLEYVEASQHFLVEALAAAVARICVMDHGADRAIVRVEKPGALRFATSVGVEIERERADFE